MSGADQHCHVVGLCAGYRTFSFGIAGQPDVLFRYHGGSVGTPVKHLQYFWCIGLCIAAFQSIPDFFGWLSTLLCRCFRYCVFLSEARENMAAASMAGEEDVGN